MANTMVSINQLSDAAHPGMVWIPGTFMMGSNEHYREEAPAHQATVDGFWMDKYAVTNAEFGRFVAATGHVTFSDRTKADDFPGRLRESSWRLPSSFAHPVVVSISTISLGGGRA